MPDPSLKLIVHHQRGIIPDPDLHCVTPAEEMGRLWKPLEQQLDVIATTFLNRVSAELTDHLFAKKARSAEEIREMADNWLKGKESKDNASGVLASLVSACRCSAIWESQLLDDKCQLEIKGGHGPTMKITIEPSVVFRISEQSKRRDRVTIRLLIRFPSSSYTTVDAAKPVAFYGFMWRVDHDLTLERGSFMQRLGIPSLGPGISSLWSGRSSRSGYRSLEESHSDHTGADQSNVDLLETVAPSTATSGSSRYPKSTNIV